MVMIHTFNKQVRNLEFGQTVIVSGFKDGPFFGRILPFDPTTDSNGTVWYTVAIGDSAISCESWRLEREFMDSVMRKHFIKLVR